MKKKIIARFFINDESVETFKALAAKLVAETRLEEGCLFYKLFQDVENKNEFVFIEEYRDEAAMTLHSKSAYLQAFISGINGLQSRELIIEVI
ncbi:MAG TPA: putative quinol monooxygenase [Prolixibacteraceae bacterium]|nr:putative quinol monooxygenase [Prolixibacteraceae bacterium]